jgi:hypothetical protein
VMHCAGAEMLSSCFLQGRYDGLRRVGYLSRSEKEALMMDSGRGMQGSRQRVRQGRNALHPLGSFSRAVRISPTLVGTICTVVGTIRTVVGTIRTVVGTICTVVGTICTVVGTIRTVVGAIRTVVGGIYAAA